MSDDIRVKIIGSIKVTSYQVALAKGFLLNCPGMEIDITTKVLEFVSQQGYVKPEKIIINQSELEPQIQKMAGFLSFSIAFCEAVHQLISSGYFVPRANAERIINSHIGYTDGRFSSGWDFNEYFFIVPPRIMRSFSKREEAIMFSDPDIFLLEIGIDNAHDKVVEALKDAINCFRNDLFHASITMLGKALEGAWVELGISLISKVSDPKTDSEGFIEKLKGSDSFAWKVQEIVKLYEKQDWFKPVRIASGIDLNTLREIRNWTDVVRDSRNAIHFGAEPATPNTYEKASILLLSAVKYFKALYKLKEYADKS